MNPQDSNNTPIFDKNTILAVVLTFAFFIIWQSFLNKKYPDRNKVEETTAQVKTTDPSSGSKEQISTTSDDIVKKTETNQASTDVKNPIIDPLLKKVPDAKRVDMAHMNYGGLFSFDLTKDGMGFRNIELLGYFDRENHPIKFTSDTNHWKEQFVKAGKEVPSIDGGVLAFQSLPIFGTTVNGQRVDFQILQLEDNVFQGTAEVPGGKLIKKMVIDPNTFSASVEISMVSNGQSGPISVETHLFDSIKVGSTSLFRPSYEGTDFINFDDESENRERLSIESEEAFKESYKNVKMTSIASQYFALALVDSSDLMPSANSTFTKGSIGVASTKVIHQAGSAGSPQKIKYKLFFGPKDRDILIKVDPLLEKTIDYGFFGFIAKPILRLLKFLHSLLGNWGFAIIFLTLALRLLLLPIALSSMRSMKKMQKIQPMLKQIKEKFKDDPKKQNLETIELMRREGANPISGCLPMFAQIPVFFALYSVLGVAIELYQSPFVFWIKDLSWQDPLYILPIIVTGLFVLQTRMSPTAMDANQKKMMTFMPMIFGVLMLSLPAGLMVYFLTNNIFGIGQQYYVNKEKHA